MQRPIFISGRYCGLASTGLHVYDLAFADAAPVLLTIPSRRDGGIEATASHNPSEYNGFNLCPGADTLYGEQIRRRAKMERNEFREKTGGKVRCMKSAPINHLLQDVPKLSRPLKVVVDAGSGVGGPIAPPLFRQLGCTVWEIACTPDGRFPIHHPDPTVPENLEMLIEKVRQEKADLGIAYDGDADRIGAVDEKGNILWGDELLVLFSRDVLKRNPNAVIISEVKCSQRLYDDIRKNGGKAIMWKPPFSLKPK